MSKTTTEYPKAMGFFHVNGFVPAFRMAKKYAGKTGRIATLPDVWEARFACLGEMQNHDWDIMQVPPKNPAWEQYYTTTSSEYYGLTRGGNHLLIVAHGNGPMSTSDGIMAAYRHQYRDKNGQVGGGRITREKFLKLESGHYGPVETLDLKAYVQSREFPFMSGLNFRECVSDPVLCARIGPNAAKAIGAQQLLATKWCMDHPRDLEVARKRREGQALRPQRIFFLEGDKAYLSLLFGGQSNCLDRDKLATANLLAISGLEVVHYGGSDDDLPGVTTRIDCHGWSDGTRFMGIREGAGNNRLHAGPGPWSLQSSIKKRWQEHTVGCDPNGVYPFFRLTEDLQFTAYQSSRKELQSSDPEFKVNGVCKVAEGEFVTPIEGYYGFFRYSPEDVRRIAPPESNALRNWRLPTVFDRT